MQLAWSRHYTGHLLSKEAYLVSVYFPLGIFASFSLMFALWE